MHYFVGEYEDSTNFTSNRFLQINSCGMQHHSKESCTILRSGGRVDFHFLYVCEGQCTVFLNEESLPLNSGEMLIYYPHIKQKYIFSENTACKSMWVHFTGYAAETVLKEAGITSSGIVKIRRKDRMSNILSRMTTDFTLNKRSFLCVSWLLQCMELIKESVSPASAAFFDERINTAVKLMLDNYSKNRSIDFYAESCHLSRDRFSHLFKDITGISPRRYIMNIRLNQAAYLLTYSKLSVKQISECCGFNDQLYFSRVFKQFYGLSPREYAKINRV